MLRFLLPLLLIATSTQSCPEKETDCKPAVGQFFSKEAIAKLFFQNVFITSSQIKEPLITQSGDLDNGFIDFTILLDHIRADPSKTKVTFNHTQVTFHTEALEIQIYGYMLSSTQHFNASTSSGSASVTIDFGLDPSNSTVVANCSHLSASIPKWEVIFTSPNNVPYSQPFGLDLPPAYLSVGNIAIANVLNYTFTEQFNQYLSKWHNSQLVKDNISLKTDLTSVPALFLHRVVAQSEGYFFDNRSPVRPPIHPPRSLPLVEVPSSADDTIVFSEYFFDSFSF